MAVHVAWIRCDCGKLHATAGMSQRSLCACGRRPRRIRWKVACINWSSPPGVPGACAYAWDGHEMRAQQFFPAWEQALAWANDMAPRTAKKAPR